MRGYRIRGELREAVVFATHDLLKDAPFSRLDLVSCRNLFIYLNPQAQQRALEIVHFALRPHGRLFLGVSETPDVGTAPVPRRSTRSTASTSRASCASAACRR